MPVNFFCYPAGRYDAAVIAAVQQAGYLGATTTNYGLARPSDLYTLARVRVNGVRRRQGLRGQARGARRLTPHGGGCIAGAGAAAIVLLLGGAGLGYYLYAGHRPRDIRGSSTVEFIPTETAPTSAPPSRSHGRSRAGRPR